VSHVEHERIQDVPMHGGQDCYRLLVIAPLQGWIQNFRALAYRPDGPPMHATCGADGHRDITVRQCYHFWMLR
jgi:hypothetical protein